MIFKVAGFRCQDKTDYRLIVLCVWFITDGSEPNIDNFWLTHKAYTKLQRGIK